MNVKKSEAANLENKRSIFREIGMIIALSLVLLAFNWKTYEKQVFQNYQRNTDDIPIELVPVTQQKPPEPPKAPKPAVILTINIVDNDSPVDEDYMIDAEANPMDTVEVYIPIPAVKDEEDAVEKEIFRVVESMPVFPGGEAALYAYLAENTEYPKIAREAAISGTVYVSFVVEKDGFITDVQLLRGIGGGCDEEAIRVVQNMPVWTPGKQRNIPVRVQYSLGVKFILYQM
jgi:protein TonB